MTRQGGAGEGFGGWGVGAQGLHCVSGRASCESEQEPTSPGLLLLLFSEPRGVLFFFSCCFSNEGGNAIPSTAFELAVARRGREKKPTRATLEPSVLNLLLFFASRFSLHAAAAAATSFVFLCQVSLTRDALALADNILFKGTH